MPTISDQFRQWVLDAAARPEVGERVEQLYAELQQQIDRRRPLCSMSGRCCRFDEYGHRLYVTTAELAAFVRGLGDRVVEASADGCPFQSRKLCTVHSIRPFGCRVFFCDPTSDSWQQDQYEHFHTRLKKLHDELSVPYSYAEWREALNAVGRPVMNRESF